MQKDGTMVLYEFLCKTCFTSYLELTDSCNCPVCKAYNIPTSKLTFKLEKEEPYDEKN